MCLFRGFGSERPTANGQRYRGPPVRPVMTFLIAMCEVKRATPVTALTR